MMSVERECEIPMYFDMLTDMEQMEYQKMQKILGGPDHRYNRNRRLITVQEQLDKIKVFCIHGDERDSVRCLVCGICWMNDVIGINTRHLRTIICKSKSSINSSLSKLNYEVVSVGEKEREKLVEVIPFLKGHYAELRQWTIRRTENSDHNSKETVEPDPRCQTHDEVPLSWSVSTNLLELQPSLDPFYEEQGEMCLDVDFHEYLVEVPTCQVDNELLWDPDEFPCNPSL